MTQRLAETELTGSSKSVTIQIVHSRTRSMRQALISIVTAAAILGHAALGCCWHHAHADSCGSLKPLNGHEREPSHVHAEHDPVHCHLGDRSADPLGEGSDKEHGPPCQDSSCTYVVTKSVELSDSASLTVMVGEELSLTLCGSEIAAICGQADQNRAAAASPRHCALLQVWRL